MPCKHLKADLGRLRRVWQLAGEQQKPVIQGMVCALMQSLSLGVAFCVALGAVSDLLAGRPLTALWLGQVSGLMGLSLGAQFIFARRAAGLSWLSAYAMTGELRLRLMAHLKTLPMGFHLSHHKGDLASILMADTQMLEGFMSEALPRIAQITGLTLFLLMVLICLDMWTGLAAMAVIIAAVPAFVWSNRRLAGLGLKRQDRQAQASARLIEYAQGITVIRAFNLLAQGQMLLTAALAHFRDLSLRMVAQLGPPLVAFAAVLSVGAPVIMFVAAERYLSGGIDSRTLVSLLIIAVSVFAPLQALAGLTELSRLAEAALIRIDRVLMTPPLSESRLTVLPVGSEVRFEGVQFAYGDDPPVLKALSFTAAAGKITAIVGHSGSGKSTLLNLVPRFRDTTGGSVHIGGADVRYIPVAHLNQLVTYVFQDACLFSGTVFDNIACARPHASLRAVENAARAAQAHDFIKALPHGYDTQISEGGNNLSGGEKQRIAIARAILKDAPIVLLDEATAAIDPITERSLQSALSALMRNKTVLIVAHRLSTLQTADQIVVLEQGRISEHGDHQTLLAHNGVYSRLWQQQTQAKVWRLATKAD
ncbi:MAG: ABC transporter ATP-binding protein [Asticcacaulis sp.]